MAASPTEYGPIVDKLLEKTRSSKLEWKEDWPRGFRAELPEGFGFAIEKLQSRGDTTYSLTMTDSGARVIFSVELTDDPETMMSNRELYDNLAEAYELARRKVLKVDEKIERVAEILEKI